MIFGYARVSTKEQYLDRQLDSLQKAGCEEIFSEKVSGRKSEKTELKKLLGNLRKGDTLIVDSLDRLGRTSKELIIILNHFRDNDISFKSLKEGHFDTTTAMGKAIMEIMAILKAMEVEVLRERTIEGIKSARARGKSPGRPKGSYDEVKATAVARLYKVGAPIDEIVETLNISRSTIYEHLRRKGLIVKQH